MLRKIILYTRDDTLADRLRDMLSDEYETLIASSSEAALKALACCAGKAAALLYAYTGEQDLSRLSQLREYFTQIPLVVLARANDDVEAKALSLGADEFISLPCDERVLRLRLARATQKSESTNEHESSEHLAAIMQNLNSGVSAAVKSGGILRQVFANDRYFDMLGYTREQFDSEITDVLALVHPNDREWVGRTFEAMFADSKRILLEFRLVRRDKNIIYIRLSAVPITLAGISEPVSLSVMSDVTEIIEAKQRAVELSEQLQTVMDNVSCGICAAVVNGSAIRYIFANDRYFELHGYTKEQFNTEIEDISKLFHPDDRQRVLDAAREVNEVGKAKQLEYRIICRDKSERWIRLVISTRRFEGIDEPVQFSVCNDITAQKLALEQASEANETLRLIMENVSSGISASVFENGEFRYIFANEQCFSIYGYTREQFDAELPRGFTDLIHPDDLDMALRTTESHESENAPPYAVSEFRAYRRDGSLIWVRTHGSLCRLRGIDTPVHIAVTTDVTKEKEDGRHIRALNKNLCDMMNDIPGGFARVRVNPDYTLSTEFVNEPLCRLRGASEQEIMRSDNTDATYTVHPDDREMVRKALEHTMRTGETCNEQYRLLRANGEYIRVNAFGRISEDEAGGTHLNVYYTELNDEQKREMTLHETLPFVLNAIMKYSNDLVFAKDKNYKYICCSPAFVKFTRQQSESDVIGRDDYDFWTKEEADHFRADDERLYNLGEPLIDYIEPIPSDDGIQHYCSTSKYILHDTHGNVIGMYGIGRDVTLELTSFEQLKLLTDSIPGGLASYVATPNEVRIRYFNDGFCRMFGYTREEYERISGTSVTSITFEEDIPVITAAMKNAMRYDTPVDCTYRVHIKDGGFKWVNLKANIALRIGDECNFNAVIFDVTEQKLAEQTAQIHEAEMRLAMSRLGKVLCEYDSSAHTLTIPEAFSRQFGLPSEIADVPNSIIESGAIDEETLPAYRAMYDAILRGDETGSAEYRDCRIDGSLRWERAEFSTIFDAQRKPIKTIIAIEDTTEQHIKYELERQRPTLGEENLLVHALFNLTTGETLDYAYADGTQVPQEERTAFTYGGDSLDTLLIDERERELYRELNDPKKLLERYENGETELSIDYRRQLTSKQIIWARNILRMVRKPGGSDILLFEYCYNIEQEKLRELMYGALVNSSYDYIARVNGKNRSFIAVTSDKVEYPLPPQSADDIDEFVKNVASEYIHPDDREMVIENACLEGIKRNLAKRDRYQFTCRMLLPDGSIRVKKLTEYYLERSMDILVVTREDVTQIVLEESKKNAQLARALEAANQASSAKTQFLSRMSHELRTPMNAIIGLAELSSGDLHDPKLMSDNITKIGMSARYLLSIINDILEMSRIESGKMSLTVTRFDFEQFLSGLSAIVYAQAAAKGVDYDVIFRSTLETEYIADPVKLQEILVNLLGNAVKFTPSGGHITLSVEQLRRDENTATLRFEVSDTGIGIDSDFIAKLFEPFSQEQQNLTSSSTGTGLGLAITKSLVEMMGGHIGVTSVKNQGSRFTADIQVEIFRGARPLCSLNTHQRLDGLRILTVDDNREVGEGVCIVLAALGIHAHSAQSLENALELALETYANNNGYDVVIVGAGSFGSGAIETVRKLREALGPDVKLIYSAYDRREGELQAKQEGADCFIEKPLAPSVLSEAIRKLFGVTGDEIAGISVQTQTAELRGRRLLLAEDNDLNVEIAKRLLERSGAQVTVTRNGLEAVHAFSDSQPGDFDAILMDIRMPVMDGLSASRSIRALKRPDAASVPIVAMTANAFDEDVELSLANGINAHLAKPIEPQLMFRTLKELIDKQA